MRVKASKRVIDDDEQDQIGELHTLGFVESSGIFSLCRNNIHPHPNCSLHIEEEEEQPLV